MRHPTSPPFLDSNFTSSYAGSILREHIAKLNSPLDPKKIDQWIQIHVMVLFHHFLSYHQLLINALNRLMLKEEFYDSHKHFSIFFWYWLKLKLFSFLSKIVLCFWWILWGKIHKYWLSQASEESSLVLRMYRTICIVFSLSVWILFVLLSFQAEWITWNITLSILQLHGKNLHLILFSAAIECAGIYHWKVSVSTRFSLWLKHLQKTNFIEISFYCKRKIAYTFIKPLQ